VSNHKKSLNFNPKPDFFIKTANSKQSEVKMEFQAIKEEPEEYFEIEVKEFDPTKTLGGADIGKAGTFVCKHENCKKIFDTKLKLNKHSKVHQAKVPCKICQKLMKPQSLYNHMQIHKKPFACDLCFKNFALKKDLNAHKLIHAGRKFICDLCSIEFSYKLSLRRHIEENHLSVVTIFSCSECSYVTKSSGNFYHHEKSHNKQFVCKICDMKFAVPSYLKRHIAIHSDVKAFKCDQCEYSGKSKHHLYKHKRSHSKPFKCPHCSKEYGQRKNLNYHLKRAHKEEENKKSVV
jgi:KRAB domain-containing zinc finger protein